jgi:hypothetical protein
MVEVTVTNEETGATLADVDSASVTFERAGPTVDHSGLVPMTVRVQVQPPTRARLRVLVRLNVSNVATGRSPGDRIVLLLHGAAVIVTDDAQVPFTRDSFSNAGWGVAARALSAYGVGRQGVTLALANVGAVRADTLTIGTPVALGARVQRVVGRVLDHVDLTQSTVTLDTPDRSAARLLATGRALPANL